MIALTFVSALLLAVVGVQWLLAPHSSRRLAYRRLWADDTRINVAAGEALISSLVSRERAGSIGAAVGTVAATVVLWLILRDPAGAPGLLPIAVVLSTLILAATAAEIAHIVRSSRSVKDNVRVAGLTPREPHLNRREAVSEGLIIGAAGVAIVVSGVAAAAGVRNAAAAATCAMAAVLTIGALVLARGWLLSRPLQSGDAEETVTAELLVSATADRFTENLVANGSVLLFYVIIVAADGRGPIAAVIAVALTLLIGSTAVAAHTGRRHGRRGAPA